MFSFSSCSPSWRRILSHGLNYGFLCHAVARKDFSCIRFLHVVKKAKPKNSRSSLRSAILLSNIYETVCEIKRYAISSAIIFPFVRLIYTKLQSTGYLRIEHVCVYINFPTLFNVLNYVFNYNIVYWRLSNVRKNNLTFFASVKITRDRFFSTRNSADDFQLIAIVFLVCAFSRSVGRLRSLSCETLFSTSGEFETSFFSSGAVLRNSRANSAGIHTRGGAAAVRTRESQKIWDVFVRY